MQERILVIAAHPDDEILGCGATVARMVREGRKAYVLILGEGITSRDSQRDIQKRKEDLKNLKSQAEQANKILGVKQVFFHDFPDNRFDSVGLLEIVKVIENVLKQIKPCMIFTHFGNDLNIDHRITCQAVITATRPLASQSVRELYSFEVASSTEWNYPLSFAPDVFYDIKDFINYKLKAIKKYAGELNSFPHPRSIKGIRQNALYWGSRTGLGLAEAFKIIRILR